jgi:hypothetical protein
MNAKQRERWAKMRKKGRIYFIFVYGVLLWGVITSIIVWIILSFYYSYTSDLFSITSIRTLITSLILFHLTGLWWGWSVWRYNEKQYSIN